MHNLEYYRFSLDSVYLSKFIVALKTLELNFQILTNYFLGLMGVSGTQIWECNPGGPVNSSQGYLSL